MDLLCNRLCSLYTLIKHNNLLSGSSDPTIASSPRTHFIQALLLCCCCYDAVNVFVFQTRENSRRSRILSFLCHSLCVLERSSCLPTGFFLKKGKFVASYTESRDFSFDGRVAVHKGLFYKPIDVEKEHCV